MEEEIEQEYTRQLNQVKSDTEKKINNSFFAVIGAIVFIPWLSVLTNRAKKKTAEAATETPANTFKFRKYPTIEKEANEALSAFHKSVVKDIQESIRAGWEVANFKNDKLVNEYFKTLKDAPEIPAKFKQRNLQSLDSFLSRSSGGMDLSKRVWNMTKEFKKELEIQISQGITEGLTPTQLSKRIKKYLNVPETAEKGKGLELLKQTHPGQGVFRSANKNALRLAKNEIQIAYRESNWERWQQQDFIIGQYIRVSAAHRIIDICDDVQGAYPKWFKFTGWHVSCTCVCMAITAKDWTPDMPDQQIMELPKGFNNWVEDNSDRIERWKNKPYFIRDNKKVVDKIIAQKKG